jgi:hypothetical protein
MAASPINNPQRILRTLDSNLEKETRIVLFGRAALALGFGELGARFGKTQDVDAILPMVEMAKIEADAQFWKAIDLTNRSLEPSGLYLAHLFTDRQIVLTPNWLDKISAIPSGDFQFLRLFRPSALDLILTKMMRGDKEDLEDIRFIMSQEKIDQTQLDEAFSSSRIPEVPELQEIFLKLQRAVRAIAREMNATSEGKERAEPTDPDSWSKSMQHPTIERNRERDREIER